MVQPMDEEPAPAPKLTPEEVQACLAAVKTEQQATVQATAAQRQADLAAGKVPLDEMTGRELAEHRPEVFEGY